MSELTRDEFISMLINELQQQKTLSGNQGQFFTGGGMKDLSTIQIFRKLCYDYPLVTNYDLRAFANDVKVLREAPSGSLDPLFFQNFNLNSQFLQNLHYFVFHEEISEDTSNQYIEDSRKEIIGNLLVEIFLEYPLYLTRLSQSQLSKVLHPTTSRIFALELDDNMTTNRNTEESTVFYGWDELLEFFRAFLLTGSSSLLVTGLKHAKVRQNLSFQSILRFLQLLKDIIKGSSKKDSEAPKVKSLEQYLQKLDLCLVETDQETHVTIYTTVKEILTHYLFMINDLLCQYPELFPTVFPQLASILLDANSSETVLSATTDIAIEATIFGNYQLLLLLKNIATFINNEEQFQVSHPKSSNKPSANDTHNQNTTNATVSTEKLSSKCETPSPINTNALKAMKETVRKFFITDQRLSLLVSFLETCYPTKRKADTSEEIKMITAKEIEIYEYYLFLGELLFGGIRMVSSISKTVYQQIISSRLLWHLLSHYYHLLKMHRSLQFLSFSTDSASNSLDVESQRVLQEYSSALWDYSVRLTKLLTTGILRDEGILQFLLSSPETLRIWTEIHTLFQNPAYVSGRHQQYPQWVLWELPLGIGFGYTCLLRSPTTAPTNSFWESFITTSHSLLVQDLEIVQTPEFLQQLTIPEEGIDEEENEETEKITEEMMQRIQTQKSTREQFHRRKQFYLKLLESIQIMCQLMNQEEFVLIRSLKGRQDPSIEEFFQKMKAFIVSLVLHLRNLRNQLQLLSMTDWRLEIVDRTMKRVKSLQSSLEGNTSNKTD